MLVMKDREHKDRLRLFTTHVDFDSSNTSEIGSFVIVAELNKNKVAELF